MLQIEYSLDSELLHFNERVLVSTVHLSILCTKIYHEFGLTTHHEIGQRQKRYLFSK